MDEYNDYEVLNNEEEIENSEEVGSGNEFNRGLALAIAGGVMAVGTLIGVIVAHCKKKADGEEPAKEKKERKPGVWFGKNRRLMIVDNTPAKTEEKK